MIKDRTKALSDGLRYYSLFETLSSKITKVTSSKANCFFLQFIFDVRCWIQVNYSNYYVIGIPDPIYKFVLSIIGIKFATNPLEHIVASTIDIPWYVTDVLVVWFHDPNMQQLHYRLDKQISAKKDWVKFFAYEQVNT